MSPAIDQDVVEHAVYAYLRGLKRDRAGRRLILLGLLVSSLDQSDPNHAALIREKNALSASIVEYLGEPPTDSLLGGFIEHAASFADSHGVDAEDWQGRGVPDEVLRAASLMAPEDPKIGERLAALRMQRALSQIEIAKRAGLTTNFVGMIERGERLPSFASLDAILDALGVASDDKVQAELAALLPPPKAVLRRARVTDEKGRPNGAGAIPEGVDLVATALYRQRLAAKLTIAELARRVGVSPTFVSAVEHGERRLSTESFEKFAAVLDLSAVRESVEEGLRSRRPVMPSGDDPGARFARLRVEAEMSQADLARLTGISPTHIGAIESSRVLPTSARLRAICAVLRLDEATAESLKDEFEAARRGETRSVSVRAVAARLVELRKRANVGQQRIAERAGLRVSVVISFEKAMIRPSARELRAMLGALGADEATTAEIVSLHTPPPP